MRRIMLLKPEVIVSCRELIAKMNFHKEMVNLIARYIILENHVHFSFFSIMDLSNGPNLGFN